MLSSQSSQSLSPSPCFPSLCARHLPRLPRSDRGPGWGVGVHPERLGALGSLRYFRSGVASAPCLSPMPLRSSASPSQSPMAVGCELSAVSPFPSPTNVDVVDAASSISPLFATLTQNTGGGGMYSFAVGCRAASTTHYPLFTTHFNLNAPPYSKKDNDSPQP